MALDCVRSVQMKHEMDQKIQVQAGLCSYGFLFPASGGLWGSRISGLDREHTFLAYGIPDISAKRILSLRVEWGSIRFRE